jgi:2,4-dienoyl-CoA reductase-like NADH-dependent reductase (Old Yellow Enzyme family)
LATDLANLITNWSIAFGRPYITNPDLAERFANGWLDSPF